MKSYFYCEELLQIEAIILVKWCVSISIVAISAFLYYGGNKAQMTPKCDKAALLKAAGT
jgi:hypothetical protein